MKRKFFTNTRVAGFMYHEGLFCYDKLKVGCELTMRRDLKNAHDPNAVALYCGEFLVGYLPRNVNEEFAAFFDMGWTDLFEVRIYKVEEDAHPEQKFGITLFIKGKE